MYVGMYDVTINFKLLYHVCMAWRVHICIRMYIRTCICTDRSIHTQTYYVCVVLTYLCIRMYVYVCTHVYICVLSKPCIHGTTV